MWSDGLNKEQFEAADIIDGPSLILAGAGTGKTRTMTARICHLIESGINPSNILAITFTNKAADELRTRLGNMLKTLSVQPMVCTYHSFGRMVLSEHYERLGYDRNIETADDEKSLSFIKDILKEKVYKEGEDSRKIFKEAKNVSAFIVKCKDNFILSDDTDKINKFASKEKYKGRSLNQISEIYQAYENMLRQNYLIDFSDLITKTVILLKENADIREQINETYQYINVDEYQDTSTSQFELAKLLAGHKQNICVVGDDYQSIYKFRGAKIENILDFPKCFAGCRTTTLTANYRSVNNIVKGAEAVIKNNEHQFKKELHAIREDDHKISIVELNTATQEAEYIAKSIKKAIQQGQKLSDIAVLYHFNNEADIIAKALSKHDIPYTIHEKGGYYYREEVQTALSYMKYLNGSEDITNFKKIMSVPRREGITVGFINNTVADISRRTKETSIWDAVNEISTRAEELHSFCDLMNLLKMEIVGQSLEDMTQLIIEHSGLRQYYENKYNELDKTADDKQLKDALDCLNAIKELPKKAKEFERRFIEDRRTGSAIEAFLHEVDVLTDTERTYDANAVNLMTMHKTKGLEFNCVFLACQDTDEYGMKNIYDDAEESRRVFYVGMTRAKSKLCISYSKSREGLYNKTVGIRIPLSYISEIPSDYAEYYNNDNYNQIEFGQDTTEESLEELFAKSVHDFHQSKMEIKDVEDPFAKRQEDIVKPVANVRKTKTVRKSPLFNKWRKHTKLDIFNDFIIYTVGEYQGIKYYYCECKKCGRRAILTEENAQKGCSVCNGTLKLISW